MSPVATPIVVHRAGTGPAVLLIHGTGPGNSASFTWSEVVPRLEAHCQTLAVDLPGFGASEPVGRETSLHDVADRLVRTLDDLGVERFGVAGHSLGGTLAAYVAMLVPARVEFMALASCGSLTPTGNLDADGNVAAAFTALIEFEAGAQGGFERLRQVWAEAAGSLPEAPNPISEPSLQAAWSRFRSRGTGGQVPRFRRDEQVHADLLRFLGATPIPLTLLWGLRDRVAPARGAVDLLELVAACRSRRLLVDAACGHMLPLECPDLLTDQILRALGAGLTTPAPAVST